MSRAVLLLVTMGVALGSGASPLAARQARVNPHGPLPDSMDCSACHTSEGWIPVREEMQFVHGARSGFELTGAHTQVACAGCHLDLRFDGPDVKADDCASCHADVHEGGMVQSCASCHTTRSFDAVDGEAVHALTSFPLTGAHRQVTCESCHVDDVGGAFTSLPTDCVSCHRPDYRSATVVDHVGSGYPTNCTECHSTVGWSDAPEFDHATVSGGFSLVGAHTGLQCADCHRTPGMEPIFAASSQEDCATCHRVDFDREHGGSGFPTTCLSCHTVDRWEGATFDHAQTGFALLGSHAELTCGSCHLDSGSSDLRFPVPAAQDDCATCHQSDYQREHAGSGFPMTCGTCHGLDRWEGASFDHAQVGNGFALEGPHATAECSTCHSVPDYGLLFPQPSGQGDCVVCHQVDFDENHTGSGYPLTCLTCHVADAWEGATFDHGTTSFPLAGAHVPADCTACHGPPGHLSELPSTPQDCVACHQVDYDENHAGSDFPTRCLECHNQSSWEGANIDHVAVSEGFVLDGPHALASCSACHSTPDYALLFPQPANNNDCVVCHQADYDANHTGSGYPVTCRSCHAANSWEGATFDHGTTGFPLVGAHAPAQCASCHGPPDHLSELPAGPQDCVACHQADYDREHAGSGFPTTCAGCHSQSSWEGAAVDHVAISGGFALTGPHATAACTACHSLPDYALLFPQPAGNNDCVSCHQAEYDANHAGSGFPTTCLSCHQPDRWDGATIDHPAVSGGFQLLGAHATASCAACHSLPGYGLLFPDPSSQNDCVACHQTDYDREHGGSGYPTDCTVCHNTSAWEPTTFDHDSQFFPIYSGSHRGKWSTCNDCHLGGNFADFTCTTCHTQGETDRDHNEVRDYVYESHACFTCHPRGRGD